jgi:hypothetical protein
MSMNVDMRYEISDMRSEISDLRLKTHIASRTSSIAYPSILPSYLLILNCLPPPTPPNFAIIS